MTEEQSLEGKEPNLGINVTFDEKSNYYIISFIEVDRAIFQVKMSPMAFEKLSNEMIRTVKNYNLFKAQQYQESLKDGKKEEVVDAGIAEGGSVPDMPRADLPSEAQPDQS